MIRNLLSLFAAIMLPLAVVNGQTVVTFESSTNWIVPAGVSSVKIEAWGGGGGGGEASNGAGGGGGGGAYSTATWTVNVGETYTVTIGAGGDGGLYLINPNGKPGNASSFAGPAGTLTANGGAGGTGGLGYLSGITIINRNGSGGSGGSGNFNGGNGGNGNNTAASGGGGAGNNGNGGIGSTSSAGTGGAGNPNNAPYLGGAGGGITSSNGPGKAGYIPGGGGGGSRSWSNIGPRVGGAGARGQIVITYTETICYDGTLTLTSATGTLNQAVCFNIPITPITMTIGGSATGATVTGLPAGVNGVYNEGVLTISGSPSESGTFNFNAITTGTPSPCSEDTISGTIIVNAQPGINGELSMSFNTSSAWPVPDGVTDIMVEAWGGGGAGGGAELTFVGIGGGGGGGAYALKNSIAVTPYDTLHIIVSDPANGIPAGQGNDGGGSTILGFEDVIYAAGGAGGHLSVFLSPFPVGGAGGSASGSKGDCTVSGTKGEDGFRVTAAIPVPVPSPEDGAGGKGATASGGNGGNPVGEFIGNGNEGNSPGGGGSGSRSSLSLTFNTTGGDGGAGRVTIYYVCPEITDPGSIAGVQTICHGTEPDSLYNVQSAIVTNGSIDYQWQYSVTDSVSDFSNIDAATGVTLQPDALTQTTWFRRLSKSKCSPDWPAEGISNVLKVSVLQEFSAGSIDSAGQFICAEGDPEEIVNEVSADGGDQKIAYQWQFSSDSVLFAHIDGATDDSYDPPSGLTATTWYRRLAKDSTCITGFSTSAGTVKVFVHPVTVAGEATGGREVCFGADSTLLTLQNYTGTVLRWQRSIPDTLNWTDIPSSGFDTYESINDTVDTWYRAVVQSGDCPPEKFSAATRITIADLYTISGTARYENNPMTSLTGLKIKLKKAETGQIWTSNTTANGTYNFEGLSNGTYMITVTSADPSGNWQTWGGVNMTDYLLVYKHVQNIALLPVSPPVVRIAADVKAPQFVPNINTADASAIQLAAKYGWGNPPWFQIPKWVFSGPNGTARIDTFELHCSAVVRDIRGLCAGDVNGTYLPVTGYKMVAPGLDLVSRGEMPMAKELTFPVTVETLYTTSLQMGALTLILNYDPSQMEITGVDMPENGSTLPWFMAEGGILSIGWASTDPVEITQNKPVLYVRARVSAETLHATSLPTIRFTLNESPLSEFADADGKVIGGVKLMMPVAGDAPKEQLNINLWPNPAKDILQVELILDRERVVRLTLLDLNGQQIRPSETLTGTPGVNRARIDLDNLPAGMYMLKIAAGENQEVRKVMVIR